MNITLNSPHPPHRVFSKVPGWDFAPLSSLVWSQCCSSPDKKAICEKVDTGVGRQIWEIFIYLDVDSVGKIHIGDICDLVLRVLRENGHVETEQNIKEWFCEEILIDFWSFFAAIVENYSGLLKVRQFMMKTCAQHTSQSGILRKNRKKPTSLTHSLQISHI